MQDPELFLSLAEIAGHELSLVCSLLGIVLFLGLWILNERTAEVRELEAAIRGRRPSGRWPSPWPSSSP